MSNGHVQRITSVYQNTKGMIADYQSALLALEKACELGIDMKDPTYCSMSFFADLHTTRSMKVNPENYAANIPVCETCEKFYPCLKVQAVQNRMDELTDLFSSLSTAPGITLVTLEQLPYALGFVDGRYDRISKEKRVALTLKSLHPSPELGVAFLCAMDVAYYTFHSGLYEKGEILEEQLKNEAFIEGIDSATAARIARQQSGLDRLPDRDVFEQYNHDKMEWTRRFIAKHLF
ncbi:MAG: hypothetical protein HZB66_02630 [Candidatus Aenigmarchaeota archaeon]|nr:hypothetical protein [Candidatus Aenigmarchaeota archaeon]